MSYSSEYQSRVNGRMVYLTYTSAQTLADDDAERVEEALEAGWQAAREGCDLSGIEDAANAMITELDGYIFAWLGES